MARPSIGTPPTPEAAQRPSATAHRAGSPPAALVVLGLTALLTVIVTAFAWPNANLAPRGVPVAVAGPAQAVAQAQHALAAAAPGGFDVRPVASAAAARAAIENREVYGAVVLGPQGAQVLTASAASPVVAQLLTELGGRLASGTAGSPAAPVHDVVPAPAADPHGAGLAAAALPIVIAGIVAAGVLTRFVRGAGPRLVAVLAYAVAGALALTAVVQLWLGSLEGSYWANSAVVALTIAAVSLTLLGLEALLGLPGLGLGAVVMLLLGNPLSAATSAPELLPSGWGTLGQLLPPGAGASALRSVAFFGGAASGGPLLVLAGWTVAGAVAYVAGARLRRGSLRRTSAGSDQHSVTVGAAV